MRVIAGTAKGVRLAPAPPGTRPVSDRAREGVFSSLAAEVPGARCLDLFAGTGAMGIEALSRGAERCVFVDRSRHASAAIRGNLQRTGFESQGEVVTEDAAAFLEAARPAATADLVFIDPPYDVDLRFLERTLRALDSGWLSTKTRPGWTVAVTRGHKGPWPAVPVQWAARRHLRYGDSLVIVYQEVGWA
jgi:16S rRNA (guanine966-N2)-methyltransferase